MSSHDQAIGHQRHRGEKSLSVHALGATLPLTLAVERAARLVGVSRSSMYAAVNRATSRPRGSTDGPSC